MVGRFSLWRQVNPIYSRHPTLNRHRACLLSIKRTKLDSKLALSEKIEDTILCSHKMIFSERELTFAFAICYRPSVCRLSVCLSSVCLSSVCLSVCRLSVTFVRPTQEAQIFGNISTALGTLAIRGHPLKILRRSSQGNPSAGGVEHKRGSKI